MEVRIRGAQPTSVVDRDHSVADHLPGERHEARTDGAYRITGCRCDVDTPMAGIATDGRERPDHGRRIGRDQPVAARGEGEGDQEDEQRRHGSGAAATPSRYQGSDQAPRGSWSRSGRRTSMTMRRRSPGRNGFTMYPATPAS